MAKKTLRDALLGNSLDALEAGRAASAGVAEQSGYVWLPLADIAPDPEQPRTHVDDDRLDRLIESIRTLGQTEPIVVQALRADEQRLHDNRRYRVLSGHRRLRAHERLGLAEIKATVVREAISADQRLLREIASNEVREDHTDYDRARFMATLFAERIVHPGGHETPESALDLVRQAVNRAFNEFDRTGAFSEASARIVADCESALRSIGERRNLRWFHRWGLPLLALTGSARDAAVAGLDARRALTISQLSPRSATLSDTERAAREQLVERLAGLARDLQPPHRDLGLVVRELSRLRFDPPPDAPQIDALLASLGADAAEPGAIEAGEHTGGQERSRAVNRRQEPSSTSDASLRQRAARVAARWVYTPSRGARSRHRVELRALLEELAAVAPSRAERVIVALERADRELSAGSTGRRRR